MKGTITSLLLMLFVSLTVGCAPAVIVAGAGATASVAHDRRTTGTIVEDNTVELKVYDLLTQNESIAQGDISVTSYNLYVLLTGQVPNAQAKSKASALAKQVAKVRKVQNELEVGENASWGKGANDALITTKVKTSLFKVEIEGFDPTRVKVKTENDVVYLMGLVTREEGRAAANQARQVSGVARVVLVFEYIEK